MTPDDRGYDKFNRIRGLLSQKFGMTHVCAAFVSFVLKNVAW
jgi:hypothetical protein